MDRLLEGAILIDTSAVIALHCPSDAAHKAAEAFFQSTTGVLWVALNITAHESYTRARYNSSFKSAITVYDFLKGKSILQVSFDLKGEEEARKLLEKYSEHQISYHDALCAVVMKNTGIYRIFTFDHHFWIMGFEILPGWAK